MKNQHNILKKGIEKPSLDFNKKLMQEIEAEEKSLNQVIQKHGNMTTSPDFTQSLMGKLEGLTPKQPYEPVISKRIWVGIAAAFITVLTLVFTTSGLGPSGLELPISVQQIDFSFVHEFESNSILIYTICGVLLLSVALLTEQRLTQKKEE